MLDRLARNLIWSYRYEIWLGHSYHIKEAVEKRLRKNNEEK